jgi:integrase
LGAALAYHLVSRRKGWEFRIRIPKPLQSAMAGRKVISEGMGTRDRGIAEAKARQRAGHYALLFASLRGSGEASAALRRDAYHGAVKEFAEAAPEAHLIDPANPFAGDGVSVVIDDILREAEARGWKEGDEADPDAPSDPLPADLQARMDAIQDHARRAAGDVPPARPEYALPFSEAGRLYLEHRRTLGDMTEQTRSQHESVYRLFAEYVSDKPFAKVTRADATLFLDEMRAFHPDWGRSPATKKRTFAELQAMFQGKGAGLTEKTLGRYVGHFAKLWQWAADRGEAVGASPFLRLIKKPKKGSNTYLPFELEELNKIFGNRPKARRWLWEVALVSLYSGLRADEICSLEWTDIRKSRDGVWYFDITEAKSEAGVRPVPVHSKLRWLLKRRPKRGAGQVWPELKPGGPDGKRSHYYSKQFTEWRRKSGVNGAGKVFHSFRKCVVQCLERARLLQNEIAEIIGHEKGFTFDTYSPAGFALKQRQRIVEKIKYPRLKLPKDTSSGENRIG